MVIISRNPVHSALFLIVTFFSLAGLYALLNAPFLAAIQVLVYAGAIMVLFLFVVMLLNLKSIEGEFEKLLSMKVLGVGAVFLLIFEVLLLVRKSVLPVISSRFSPQYLAEEGNTKVIGKLLFTEYLLPFEITSILLIVAIIGAVVLAKKSLRD
jgi:NADH-quinone oxidoreductase subunit J